VTKNTDAAVTVPDSENESAAILAKLGGMLAHALCTHYSMQKIKKANWLIMYLVDL
jgi:hypothetical protein